MADRTCHLCGKSFQLPCHLKRHHQRKTPCAPIVEHHGLSESEKAKRHACRFCGHRFTYASGLSNHVKKSCKIAGSDAGMELLYEHTLKRQDWRTSAPESRPEAQAAELAALKTQMNRLAAAPALVQQVVGVQQNIGTVNINIFGKEDTSHVDRLTMKELLDSVLVHSQAPAQAALVALLKTATLIYSDPNHPENLTCYLPNKKQEDVLVHGTAGWEIQPCPLVLPPMVAKSVDTLFDKQPFEDAAKYGDLMAAIRDNEQAHCEGKGLKAVLVRNKALLEKTLGSLPR